MNIDLMTKPNPVAKALRTPKFRSLVIKSKKTEYTRKPKHRKLSEDLYSARDPRRVAK